MREAIILAGGLGTRLRSEVPDVPKPMAPIRNRPFLEYLLDYWIECGVKSFILSVGYMSEKIKLHFGTKYKGAKISYSYESVPLGTGGGLLLALQKTKEQNVLVLNGDTLFKVPLIDFHKFHQKQCSIMSISLFKFGEKERFGAVRLDENNYVTSIEPKSSDISGDANGGVYLIKVKDFIDIFKNKINKKISLEEDLIKTLINSNSNSNSNSNISGKLYKKTFIDIGIPKDFRASSDII